MKVQEAIRRGNLKFRELKGWVQLRKKSMLIDVEIKELETESAQACCVNKLIMTRQDMGQNTTALEDLHQEFVALLPWL